MEFIVDSCGGSWLSRSITGSIFFCIQLCWTDDGINCISHLFPDPCVTSLCHAHSSLTATYFYFAPLHLKLLSLCLNIFVFLIALFFNFFLGYTCSIFFSKQVIHAQIYSQIYEDFVNKALAVIMPTKCVQRIANIF